MAYLGESIPKLGFGLMRLPMCGGEVDLDQLRKMVDLFLEKGFTYFDTAFGYLDGKSEAAAKAVLVDRYPRERFQLATKLPATTFNAVVAIVCEPLLAAAIQKARHAAGRSLA